MVSIRQFGYFNAVAETRHFGRAAEQCSVSQPALSMQIRQLEQELGVQLLERHRDGTRLTGIGREIAGRVSRILHEVRDLKDFARHGTRLLAGKLRLGVIPTLTPYVLPSVLPRLRSQHPDLDLEIRETQTSILMDELQAGKLDAVLAAMPLIGTGIETGVLFEDPFLLAVHSTGQDVADMKVSVERACEGRLLLLEEGHCLRDQALSFCHAGNRGNIDTLGASSLSTIVQMVANGMGMTLLPQLCIEVELKNLPVQVMRFEDPAPRRQIALAWRTSSPRKRDFVGLGRIICGVCAPQR